ncbi:N-acetylmuramoyl-L-alanine amidase [bacterium]|nr:N-acetylmuramoyl-L-alanine amidase [bacterium]
MKRIILHWTAGRYYPSSFEKQYYHYLIDKEGRIYTGIYAPEDNLNCNDNKYAAHTGGGNTGSIGVAFCAMSGFKSINNVGNFPITPIQFESGMDFCASLCSKYSINITPETVMTHYEFGQKHPQTTSAGKIDIIYLPPYSWVAKNDIGSFIRSKIRWYYTKNSRG